MRYSELITQKKEYKYSANLCFDLKNENKLGDYIPNIMTTEILREYLCGIVDKTNVHSRILYGSYGTGKSHLLTVLCALLGQMHTDGEAFANFLHAIEKYDKSFAEYLKDYVDNQKPYFVVPVYSDHKDFDKCISFSLKKEFKNRNIEICFKSYFQEALELLKTWEKGKESAARLTEILANLGVELKDLKNGLDCYRDESENIFNDVFKRMTYGATFVSDTGSLLDNLDMANQAVSNDYQGIVFVFDEFGRFLEDRGEALQVKSIQDLAEYCDHSDYNTHVILVSHKQLSLYTEKMRKDLSDEWKKVEGRYRATSMNTKYDQCLPLISHIIPKTDKWEVFRKKYNRELQDLFGRAYDFKGFLHPQQEEEPFVGGFPLHPIALYVLDRLSKKVAQNERTFFTYLASDEDNTLFKQLEQMDTEKFHFVGLDMLYDYFETSIRSYRSDTVYENYKKLQYAINKLGTEENIQLEKKVLKTIAVINIIGDTTILAADRMTLKYVIDEQDVLIEQAIDSLVRMKIVKFMRQYGYYDFFDGSIYDFDSMIDEKIQRISTEMVIKELNESFINFVVYPYEYNSKYHINRIFIPFFVQRQKISKKIVLKIMPAYYDGILAMVIDDDFSEAFYLDKGNLPERSILLVNHSPENFLAEVKRFIAIKYFYSIRDELKKEDPTAVRELELYLEEQKGIVNENIRQWKSFELSNIVTFIAGERKDIMNEKDLSKEASSFMFRSFCKTMIVNNDVVNKNNVSGTIRSSRKKVVAAIIGESGEKNDFAVMSPEHTMIRSVLQKNGFGDADDSITQNYFPEEARELHGECSGRYVKAEILRYLKKCTKALRPLSELMGVLKQEPFGLRGGYIPLLLADGLKNYQNVGIYFHGDEKEYSSEELLKACEKPEDYSFYLCNWTEEQAEYISELEEIFADYLTKNPKNRLKELLGAMNVHYAAIPKIARVTNRYISDAAGKYREIMSVTHKDFYKFFFMVLPEIESSLQTLPQIIKRICLEFENVLQSQSDVVETVLRNMLQIMPNDTLSSGLKRMYEVNWAGKRTHVFDYQTNAFLNYVQAIHPEEEDRKVVESLARIIAGFDIDYWNDSTIENFQETLRTILNQLNEDERSEKLRENEIQIIVKSAGDEAVVSTFYKREMSQNGQIMLNKMKKTISSFGQSISQEEKMVILAQLLSDI